MTNIYGRTFVIKQPKPPWDAFFVEVDVSSWLDTDTISSVTFSATDSDGNDATNDVLDPAKNTNTTTTIKPYITGGDSGKTYSVVMKATSDAGDRLSCQVVFSCLDY